MSRLNIDRQNKLEPIRISTTKKALEDMGYVIHYQDNRKIKFMYKGYEVTLYPYSGWHTGKSIKDGRGFNQLLKQLEK